MPVLMILLDGVENGEYGCCPVLSRFEPAGRVNNTPPGFETDSLSCIMTILGVEPGRIPGGRAYLEALALGLELNEGDLVFRCNYIDVDADGVLRSSYRAGRVNETDGGGYRLTHIDKHKYLLIVNGGAQYFPSVKTFPPHQNTGRPLSDILPQAAEPLRETLLELIYRRSIFPWGQAVRQDTPSFYSLHKKRGAIVAKTEIVVGMGRALGMFCPKLARATADVDTDLDEKISVSLGLCREYDFVLLHINGTDESAHRRDKAEKLAFLSKIDETVISRALQNAGGLGVIVTADHETSAQTGRHLNSAVCYYFLNNSEECAKWLK